MIQKLRIQLPQAILCKTEDPGVTRTIKIASIMACQEAVWLCGVLVLGLFAIPGSLKEQRQSFSSCLALVFLSDAFDL